MSIRIKSLDAPHRAHSSEYPLVYWTHIIQMNGEVYHLLSNYEKDLIEVYPASYDENKEEFIPISEEIASQIRDHIQTEPITLWTLEEIIKGEQDGNIQ